MIISRKLFRKQKNSKDAPLSSSSFGTLRLFCLIYTILWFGAVAASWYFWHSWGWYKYLIEIIIGFGTPSITDLFKSYEKYLENFEKSKNYKGWTNDFKY